MRTLYPLTTILLFDGFYESDRVHLQVMKLSMSSRCRVKGQKINNYLVDYDIQGCNYATVRSETSKGTDIGGPLKTQLFMPGSKFGRVSVDLQNGGVV